LNIGVLPIQISEGFLSDIFCQIDSNPKSNFKVDLEIQEFKIVETGKSERFNISSYKKSNMSNGFDDIDYLINKKQEISKFADNSQY
jgi:3-isopropylmalate/(R)-2-methylmalate dehydratase small subunit